MAAICSLCSHQQRDEIDATLVRREKRTAVAARYGVGRRSVFRHLHHIELAKAHEAHDVARADRLLDDARSLQKRALTILAAAEGTKDYRTALSAIREVRSVLELLGKLAGTITDAVTVNTIQGDVIQIAGEIGRVLAPWPAAARAVADHLAQLTTGDAP